MFKVMLVLGALAAATNVQADERLRSAWGEEVFMAFPVDSVAVKAVAAPEIRNTEYWSFRTRIRGGAADYLSDESARYAGRYALVTWGCGSSCQSGAIVDVLTGKVARLPTASCGYAYRAYSGLLVTNPDYNPDTNSVVCSLRSFYLLQPEQAQMGRNGYSPFFLLYEESTTIDRGLESYW